MRKSISYKQGRKLIRSSVRRLLIGIAASYVASLCIMALFRHYGSEPLMVVGFLCVFAFMPALVLVVFSLPRRKDKMLAARTASTAAFLAFLPVPGLWIGLS
ncbi:hypothetical protein [Asaia bogorensis]|uniref:hypothetical protein n=1 Tax=Asaia bogorensis TaxID=91915 RepID=UPI000EFD2FFE|nr:hypothetical protein [Asaia bogorensis]